MQASKAVQTSSRPWAFRFHPLHPLFTMVAPACFIALLVALKLVDAASYKQLVREDGIFEYLTFFIYFIGTACAAIASITLWRKGERFGGALVLVFALGLLGIGGEEISWGQRIFQIQSSEFFQQANYQHETNVHNMLSNHKLHFLYIAVSLALAFSWLLLPLAFRPLPARLRAFLSERIWMLAPDRMLMLFFVPCTLMYIYLERGLVERPQVQALLGPALKELPNPLATFIIHRDQEPLEMLLGSGLTLFMITILWRARQLPASRPEAAPQAGA